jgi:hypothetical protein
MRFAHRMILAAAMAVTATAAAAVAPASAASPPKGPVGYEIRGAVPGQYEAWEHHLWRFRPDGRITGHLYAQQIGMSQNGYIEKSDVGYWRLAGDRMCVTWNRWFHGRELCYRLRVLNGGRFYFKHTNGRLSFEGTYQRGAF